MPRFAGLATLMRLPYVQAHDPEFADVEIGLVGIPWDGGTTNRPGARHGPRQVRDISTMIRNVNRASGIAPFSLCNCADLGDTPVNPVDLMDSLARIHAFYDKVCAAGIAPLSVGGDHLVSLPIMRALATALERQNQWQLCCIRNISPISRNERSLGFRPCRLFMVLSMPWA